MDWQQLCERAELKSEAPCRSVSRQETAQEQAGNCSIQNASGNVRTTSLTLQRAQFSAATSKATPRVTKHLCRLFSSTSQNLLHIHASQPG